MASFSRRVDTQDRRVVTVGGGLNERFSRLEKPSIPKQPSIQRKQSSSVFTRIRSTTATTTKQRNNSGIQSRLGRVSGGIQKRDVKQTVERRLKFNGASNNNNNNRRNLAKQVSKVKGKATVAANHKTGATAKQSNKKTAGKRNAGKEKKSTSVDDLDKALDSYMLKDPKTAQARLDDELNSYMDEAGDVLMNL